VNFEAFVEVRKHPGIADPEGATIERALPTLGFAGVSGVSVGKAFRLTVEAADEAGARATVEALAERLLANPVLEEVRVSLVAAEGAPA
jgi:phosphoribosylformylglycinamidine synthase subunit PurS